MFVVVQDNFKKNIFRYDYIRKGGIKPSGSCKFMETRRYTKISL